MHQAGITAHPAAHDAPMFSQITVPSGRCCRPSALTAGLQGLLELDPGPASATPSLQRWSATGALQLGRAPCTFGAVQFVRLAWCNYCSQVGAGCMVGWGEL